MRYWEIIIINILGNKANEALSCLRMHAIVKGLLYIIQSNSFNTVCKRLLIRGALLKVLRHFQERRLLMSNKCNTQITYKKTWYSAPATLWMTHGIHAIWRCHDLLQCLRNGCPRDPYAVWGTSKSRMEQCLDCRVNEGYFSWSSTISLLSSTRLSF